MIFYIFSVSDLLLADLGTLPIVSEWAASPGPLILPAVLRMAVTLLIASSWNCAKAKVVGMRPDTFVI